MKKRKKILAPIDFSPCSENALNYAMRLATKLDASLEILYVATHDGPPLDFTAEVGVLAGEKISMSQLSMKRFIEKAKKRIAATSNSIPDIETDIEVGIPEIKILEIAARDQIDYIVMGTQGQHSVWDRFMGSTAEEVVQKASCVVFVIPENVSYQEDLAIAYASDFMDADVFQIWKTTKILEDFKASISAVHLSEKAAFTKDKIDELVEFFDENAPELDICFYSFPSKDLVADLNAFIEDHHINLMVMYKPKRNLFERIFHRSFTKKMVKQTQVPLLILAEQ